MPQASLKRMTNPYTCPHCKAEVDHIRLDGVWFRCDLTDEGKIVLPRMLTPQKMGQMMREEVSPFVCPECIQEIEFDPDGLPEFEAHRKHQIQRYAKLRTAHILGQDNVSKRLREEIEFLAMEAAKAMDEDALDDQVATCEAAARSSASLTVINVD